jgi:large repetitive protein
VNYTAPMVSDPAGATVPSAVCSPPSGSTFAVGTTTVHCTASDSDDANSPVTTSFTVTVTSAGPNVIILTKTLPTGTLGQPYSFQLQAIGDTPPYSWNKYLQKGMGTLPLGVGLSPSGLISGTPKRAGTYTFTVKCLDSSHSHKTQATQTLTLTINP